MNRLLHITDFKEILKNYKPSEESQQLLKKVDLMLLIAPSSTGRNTIISDLVHNGSFKFVVSDTTRNPRTNNGLLEQNGEHYWFKNELDVLEGLRKGMYLEAEIIHSQQVSGISMIELEKAHQTNLTAITDIDLGGIEAILKYKPDAKIVLLLPPTFEEWIKRIKGRGEMSESELSRRLSTALTIFNAGLKNNNFQIIVNDNIDESVNHIKEIAKTSKIIKKKDKSIENIIKELIKDTTSYLEKKVV